MKKVCILGLGYIGLPTAAMFAINGVQVVGVDINDQIINTINQGGIHIKEAGLEDAVRKAFESGNMRAALTPEPADAFIIAVPTPFYEDKKADMRAVTSAAESIVPYLRSGNLVVLESTSPPLTTVKLVQPILEKSGLKAGHDFLLAYSPERVLPGQILNELVNNARVIGGINSQSAQAGKALYETFVKGEIVLTDATTAEMVKLMENTYRDINIAIANEFARLADRFGISVWDAISIANRHPRVKILKPGPGVGGHCISVDPWFLVESAPDITPLIQASRKVNDMQPHYVFDLIKRALGGKVKDRRVALLGLSYKADVDDLRESPAVEVASLLAHAGALVKAFEPNKPEAQFSGFTSVASLDEVLSQAEIVVLLVGHKQFNALDAKKVADLTPARIIVDAVNGWSGKAWDEAGFKIIQIGVGSTK